MSAQPRYWIGVVGNANFELLRNLGFRLFAVSDRFSKKLSGLTPGDKLLLYRSGAGRLSGFCITSTVASAAYTCASHDAFRRFPHRIDLAVELDVSDHPLSIGDAGPQLNFVQNKSAAGQYLQTQLREISAVDYQVIETALRRRAP